MFIRVYGCFDASLFSRVVSSFTYLVETTKNIHPKCFFFIHVQIILEVIEIFGQLHCSSSYRNDLYGSDQFPFVRLF